MGANESCIRLPNRQMPAGMSLFPSYRVFDPVDTLNESMSVSL